VGLTRVLSLEWAPRGITVNAVSPTVVETPLGKAAWAGEKGEKARARGRLP
jgi:2-deoxy-D-gluconate 3-dehydrogenase